MYSDLKINLQKSSKYLGMAVLEWQDSDEDQVKKGKKAKGQLLHGYV